VDIREILSRKKIIDIDSCLPDGVVYVSSQGKICWSNKKAPLMFSISKKELTSSFINDLLENGLELVKKASMESKPLVTKVKNSERYFEMTSNQVSDGYVVDLRDTTQSYKAVTSILVEQESSKKISRDKNNFILKLSNDLKSPLHSILGFSQALLDGIGGEINEKQEKYIKIINKNSTELLYLMEKFFDLSKSEFGLVETETKTFDIPNMINAVVKYNEQLYKDKNLSVTFETDEYSPRTIMTCEKHFKLMLQNLIETLIRMTDIGVIKIKLSTPTQQFLETHNITPVNEYVMLSFVNSGAGLPDNEAETIFDPYAVVEKSNKKHLLRTLSLGAVKNLVKLLNGILWVESEVITGTSFNMIFPTGRKIDQIINPQVVEEPVVVEEVEADITESVEPEVVSVDDELASDIDAIYSDMDESEK